MKMHTSREGECPNGPLQCDFASVGCQFIGTEAKLQNHLERDTMSHLSLAMKSLYNVTENLAKSEMKQQETEMKLVRMKDTQLQFHAASHHRTIGKVREEAAGNGKET